MKTIISQLKAETILGGGGPIYRRLRAQGFIQALLMTPVLWKKIEFYKEESNHEAIMWGSSLPLSFFPSP